MRIQSPKSFWTGMGRETARRRMPISTSLTGTVKVDAWITAGFKAMKRKIDKREIAELGNDETMALVKRKLDF